MDALANLLAILLYLSALYTALGFLGAACARLARLATWRPWRPSPSTQRRPRRVRPRRRIERDETGAVRRPVAAGGRPRATWRLLGLGGE